MENFRKIFTDVSSNDNKNNDGKSKKEGGREVGLCFRIFPLFGVFSDLVLSASVEEVWGGGHRKYVARQDFRG